MALEVRGQLVRVGLVRFHFQCELKDPTQLGEKHHQLLSHLTSLEMIFSYAFIIL